jgi:hypothetical protein
MAEWAATTLVDQGIAATGAGGPERLISKREIKSQHTPDSRCRTPRGTVRAIRCARRGRAVDCAHGC